MDTSRERWSKAVEEFGELLGQLREQAGLTVQELADLVGVAKSTIWKLEHGGHAKPPHHYQVHHWVQACTEHAQEAGRELSTPTDLRWWRTQHGDLERLHDRVHSPSRAASPEERRRWPNGARCAWAFTLPSPSPLMGTGPLWTPRDVKRPHSIPAGEELPLLPAYVERAHDRKLRTLLSGADSNLCVVVTGSSSTGKTRSMWEAVGGLADWSVIRPEDADALVRCIEAGVEPRTVVWLDELQEYLLDHADGVAAARLC